MLNLKSIYFYFLSIKIFFLKFIKKIYFRSDFYNNSLKSIAPKQFYFFPNSFLLSSFTSNDNFSFKLENLNPGDFWSITTSQDKNKNLQNFLWLNLVDRKSKTSIIRKIITDWMYKNKKYNPDTWESSILSIRIISWILNANIIFGGPNFTFKADFLNSIIIQINHLKKNFRFERNEIKKIEMLTAILLSGLIFKEYEENFTYASKELKKTVDAYFDEHGFPLTKNPNNLLKVLKHFILIKECIKEAQYYVPDFLEEIIDKNINSLKSITSSINKLPLFNGGTEIDLVSYYEYLSNLGIKSRKIKNNISSIKVIKNKKDFIFFDSSDPPKKNYSSAYQCGPLSFEYYLDTQKIITNCGFGENISKKAILLSRLTSAQSTLCINDTSVLKFERNKFLNKAFGNSLKGNFTVSEADIVDNENEIKVTSSHNAYLNNYGYLHKREIKLDKKIDSLKGEDQLIKKKASVNLKYSIRFHLYPGINAVYTIGGKNVLMHITKNKSLIFSANGERLSIEKSIFLGGNKILNNLCITISGILVNENKTINWEIKKKI